MAYTAATLRRVADFSPTSQGAAIPGLFTYLTADALTDVIGSNYFDSAADRLPLGSVIIVSAGYGGTEATNHYVVSTNTGSAVTLTAALDAT